MGGDTSNLNFANTITPSPNGTVITRATLDGQPWPTGNTTGSVNYFITAPNGVLIGLGVPATTNNSPTGQYTFSYKSGGPPNSAFVGVTPSETQNLISNGTITFTMNFSTAVGGGGEDPQITNITTLSTPEPHEQFYVRIDGINFDPNTVRVVVTDNGACQVFGDCQVPNDVLKAFGNVSDTVLERVPLTVGAGSYQIFVENGNPGPVSNPFPFTVNVPPTIGWEFNTNGNQEGWVATNAAATLVANGIFFIDPNGGPFFIDSPSLSASAFNYQYLQMSMASNATNNTGRIFFKTDTEDFYSDDKQVPFDVQNCSLCGNGPFIPYTITMGVNLKWRGRITGIRVSPADTGTSGTNHDSIGIDYIRLTTSQ